MERKEPSDQELVARIVEGSEDDFNILYNRYFKKVYNFTYQKLRDHGDTEELVQEIFYCVFTSLKGFEGRSTLLSWIYGITKNNINNYFRRNRQPQIYLEEMESTGLRTVRATSAYGPDFHFEMKEAVNTFDRALSTLSESQYQMFMMRHLEDLSIDEIASRTRKSKDSVKSNLYRIKKLLAPQNERKKTLAWA
jgi:RNA polymerase sigma-70 factor (ECF subfamily)